MKSITNIITSVVNYYEWEPFRVERLFLDREDYNGVLLYYDNAVEADKAAKKTQK